MESFYFNKTSILKNIFISYNRFIGQMAVFYDFTGRVWAIFLLSLGLQFSEFKKLLQKQEKPKQ